MPTTLLLAHPDSETPYGISELDIRWCQLVDTDWSWSLEPSLFFPNQPQFFGYLMCKLVEISNN